MFCQQKRKIAVVEAKKEKPIKKMKERENQCLFERKSPKRKKKGKNKLFILSPLLLLLTMYS